MLYNRKNDKLMEQIMNEVHQGTSIYTMEQEDSIRIIMHKGITQGKNFNKIYKEDLEETFPLPKGAGLMESYYHLREIFAEEAKRYKEAVKVDKEVMWNLLFERYTKMFDDGNREDKKRVLDSMLKLLSISNQEKVLDNASGENIEYHITLDV